MHRILRIIGFVLLLEALLPPLLTAQTHVSGIVRDGRTGEFLIGAHVFDPVQSKGTSTDNNGYFSIVVDRGSDSLVLTYVGYAALAVPLRKVLDNVQNINMLSGF